VRSPPPAACPVIRIRVFTGHVRRDKALLESREAPMLRPESRTGRRGGQLRALLWVAVRASRQTLKDLVGAGLPGTVLTLKRRPLMKTSSGRRFAVRPKRWLSLDRSSGCPKALANCLKLGL
jgi:hypothetical protein